MKKWGITYFFEERINTKVWKFFIEPLFLKKFPNFLLHKLYITNYLSDGEEKAEEKHRWSA